QPAAHDVRLRGDAGDLLVVRARRRPTAAGHARAPPGDPAHLPVGHVPAQPRRAHARPAVRGRAPGVLRLLRRRPGAAAVRARAAPPAAPDARRRPAPDPDGVQPGVLAAGLADAVLR